MSMYKKIIALAVMLISVAGWTGDSAPFLLDTTDQLVATGEEVSFSYNSSWIGDDSSAEVVISTDGTEIKRTTDEGEFTWSPITPGKHTLTYTTYINGVAQDEVYTATVYADWKYTVEDGKATIVETTQKSGSVTIPSEIDGYPVVEIATEAFAGCSDLTSVTIPNIVTNIAANAFSGCVSLRYVELPYSLKSQVEKENLFASCPSDMEIYYVRTIEELFGGGWQEDSEGVGDVDVVKDSTVEEGASVKFSAEDSSSVWVETVVTNAGRVSFDWKISSEKFKNYKIDYFSFLIDGQEMVWDNGEVDWITLTFEITGEGEHTLRWAYTKDESGKSGQDCAWLKDFSFTPLVTVAFGMGDAEGGSLPENVTGYSGSTIVIPEDCILTKAKHAFAGWTDGVQNYVPGDAYTLPRTDITLLPVWTAKIVEAPVIEVAERYYTQKTTVSISCQTEGARIYYTLDGSEPNAESNLYEGPFEVAESVVIRAFACKDDWFSSEVTQASTERAPWTSGECLNSAHLSFLTDGGTGWARDLDVSHDGQASMRSAAIGDSQESSISLTVDGPGEISFWWKVSSESYKNYQVDYLSFTVDGVECSWICGDVDWRKVSFAIEGDGAHEIKWTYKKDAENSEGNDAAWLDEVMWKSASEEWPLPDPGTVVTLGDWYEALSDDEGISCARWEAFWMGANVAIPVTGLSVKIPASKVEVTAGTYSEFGTSYVLSESEMWNTYGAPVKRQVDLGNVVYEEEDSVWANWETEDDFAYELSDEIWPDWEQIPGRQWIVIPTGVPRAGTHTFGVRINGIDHDEYTVSFELGEDQHPLPYEYKVTFDANGGAVSQGEVIVEKGEKLGALPVPTRSGYMFTGWFTASEGGAQVTADTVVIGDMTLFAQWEANNQEGGDSGDGDAGGVVISNVRANQRFPWNGLVDITCEVSGIVGITNGLQFAVNIVVPGANVNRTASSVWIVCGNVKSTDLGVQTNGNYRLLWDAKADLGEVCSTNMVVSIGIGRSRVGMQLWEGGPYWATTNIGAENPEDYGYYFWWGDTVGYKRENDKWVASDGSNSDFSFTESNAQTYGKSLSTLQSEGWITSDGVLVPKHDAATIHWGNGWRMPTKKELDSLRFNCDLAWIAQNGMNGMIVKGRGAYTSNSIFFPCVGYGTETSFYSDMFSGSYWSSVAVSDNEMACWKICFNMEGNLSDVAWRNWGHAIRPVIGSGGEKISSELVPLALDTRDAPVMSEAKIAYDSSWIGSDPSATVVISDNGNEVYRGSGAGNYEWTSAASGRHTLTYTTYINGVAQDEVYEATVCAGYKYEVVDAKAILQGMEYQNGVLNIPSEIDGYPVVEIAAGAFAGCTDLTSVTIPNSVTNIRSAQVSAFGLAQVKFDSNWDVTSSLSDAVETNFVSGVISAYQKAFSSPWEFSDPLTGEVFKWNNSSTTFAYFGQMYMESGKTYVFGANFDDSVLVKIDGETVLSIEESSGYSLYTGSYLCEYTGWYDIEVRLGDVSGEKGSWGIVWSDDFGVGYREDGLTSDEQNGWKRLIDPGDGSLFRCVKIGESAFIGCSNIRNVTVPAIISNTMFDLFPDSYEILTNVTLTGSVAELSNNMFDGCALLTSVNIPEGVEKIGTSTFNGCASLTSVTIPDGVTNIGGYAFYGCSGLASVTIPDSVTNIAQNAFSGCTAIRQVTIPMCYTPEVVPGFYEAEFRNMSDLDDSISIIENSRGVVLSADKLTAATIGSYTMYGYVGQMYFEKGVDYEFLGYYDDKSSIKIDGVNVISPATGECVRQTGTVRFDVSGWHDIEIRGWNGYGNGAAYSSCDGIMWKKNGGAWQEFADDGDGAKFRANRSSGWQMKELFPDSYEILTNVTLTGSVVELPEYMFDGCALLTSVNIPEGVEKIGTSTFNGCASLTSVIIPDGVTSIGANAFADCLALERIVIPGSVTDIDFSAFQGCTSLKYIEVNNGNPEYTMIDGVLYNKDVTRVLFAIPTISSAIILNSVTNITSNAFIGCVSINYVELPRSLKSEVKEWDVFASCSEDIRLVYVGDFELVLDGEWHEVVVGMGDVDVVEDSTAEEGASVKFTANDSSSIWIETVVTNAGRVSFDWKISCEKFKDYKVDYFSFLIDGQEMVWDNGEVDWTNLVYEITGEGEHVLRWTYTKDESGKSGQDCAWLKDFSFTPLVTVAFSMGDADEGDLPESVTGYSGDTIVIPEDCVLRKAKHTFAGWTDGALNYVPGEVYTLPYANVTLLPVWVAKTVEAPLIEVAEKYYTKTTTASMSCQTEGALIYYTLDGSEPTMESNLYQGPFEVEGTAVIRAFACKDDWFSSEVTQALTERALWTSGECLNSAHLPFSTDDSNGWVRDMNITHDGQASMRSGTIGDSQESSISLTVNGPGEISFWWKVSSESYKNYQVDYLSFTVDGVERHWICGEVDWAKVSFVIEDDGAHELKWTYKKDTENSEGRDAAWLDEVVWMPESSAVLVDMGNGKSVAVPAEWIDKYDSIVTAAGGDKAAALQQTAANGRKVWECFMLGVDPTKADDDFKITRFWMEDGVPKFEFSHSTDGAGNSFVPRIKTKGKAKLSDVWSDVPVGGNSAFRFFTVEVALP